MVSWLKLLGFLVALQSASAFGVLIECHKWLRDRALAVADVGSPRHTLVVTKDGVLEFHHPETGHSLREPIRLGPDTLRLHFPPICATISEDGSRVTLEYLGLGLRTYHSATGLLVNEPARESLP